MLAQPVLSPLATAGDEGASLQQSPNPPAFPRPPKDGLTGQLDPTPASPSNRRSCSSRQADAGSSPGTVLDNTSSATTGATGAHCLTPSTPLPGLRDCQHRGSQEPMLAPPCSHHTSHPCSRRASPALPLPLEGPEAQAGLAPCWLHSSQGAGWEQGQKPSESSHGDMAGEMDWSSRGRWGACTNLWPSPALGVSRLRPLPELPALHKDKPTPLSP